MNALAAAGTGFLLAVLWFDLMFDVQIRRGAVALASIAAYYRRVTTEASPMNSLVPAVMFVTLAAIVVEGVQGVRPWWSVWPALALAASAIGLTLTRTVPNAVRLGAAKDPAEVQLNLAQNIYTDHIYCFAAMTGVVVSQIPPL